MGSTVASSPASKHPSQWQDEGTVEAQRSGDSEEAEMREQGWKVHGTWSAPFGVKLGGFKSLKQNTCYVDVPRRLGKSDWWNTNFDIDNFHKGPFISGFGIFLDQKDTVWCLASFKQVEQHFPSIFKSYSHSYYAETYPSLWVVFKSSETSIHAFTTSVHYLAYFCGQQIPWNWGCSITRGLSQFDHVTSRWHFSVASWRLASFGDKVCNKSQKRIYIMWYTVPSMNLGAMLMSLWSAISLSAQRFFI